VRLITMSISVSGVAPPSLYTHIQSVTRVETPLTRAHVISAQNIPFLLLLTDTTFNGLQFSVQWHELFTSRVQQATKNYRIGYGSENCFSVQGRKCNFWRGRQHPKFSASFIVQFNLRQIEAMYRETVFIVPF